MEIRVTNHLRSQIRTSYFHNWFRKTLGTDRWWALASGSLFNAALVVLSLLPSDLNAQSVRLHVDSIPSAMAIPYAVGMQLPSSFVNYQTQAVNNWWQQLNAGMPGYASATLLATDRFIKTGSLPPSHELHFSAIANSQITFLVPEGHFVRRLAPFAPTSIGQSYSRVPLRRLVEQQHPGWKTLSEQISLRQVSDLKKLVVPTENLVSASRLITSLQSISHSSDNLIPHHQTGSIDHKQLSPEQLRIFDYLLVRCYSPIYGNLAILLPTNYRSDVELIYHDAFLNTPLHPEDELSLLDQTSTLDLLRSFQQMSLALSSSKNGTKATSKISNASGKTKNTTKVQRHSLLENCCKRKLIEIE